MSVTPGFSDLYPGNETARGLERKTLEHLDVEGLALAISHAVETGEIIRAAAAQEQLQKTVKSPDEIFGDYTIPDSWRDTTK